MRHSYAWQYWFWLVWCNFIREAIDIRIKKDNERIKTNITLPAWLKRIAEEQKVNDSRLLETALIDYLQIPVSGRQ